MKPSDALRHATGANSPVSRDALEAFFAACQAELLGMLYFQTGSIQSAREALQQCFAECWRHCDTVTNPAALRSWVFGQALQAGRRYTPSQARHPMDVPAVEDNGQPRQGLPGGEVPEDGHAVGAVRQCLKSLASDEREVFLLRENGQLSYDEIAQLLGVPLEAVKTRMRTALAKLWAATGENP